MAGSGEIGLCGGCSEIALLCDSREIERQLEKMPPPGFFFSLWKKDITRNMESLRYLLARNID